jgi:hypothetical protein
MDKKETIAKAEATATAAEASAATTDAKPMQEFTLVLRRDFKLGERDRLVDDVIGQLKLDADVTLAFLGDAITHGFVGPQ